MEPHHPLSGPKAMLLPITAFICAGLKRHQTLSIDINYFYTFDVKQPPYEPSLGAHFPH